MGRSFLVRNGLSLAIKAVNEKLADFYRKDIFLLIFN